jgi:protocatechuate 3,4-dioxygenase beta subunit
VQGKVVTEVGGRPIQRVVVQLASTSGEPEGQYATATDATGVFRFEGVQPGQYLVTIRRAGYLSTSKRHDEGTITVEQGQNVTDLLYKMQATGVIAGKIVDADGDPVAGVEVIAIGSEKGQTVVASGMVTQTGAAKRGVTNDLGEYRIANLRAGQYVVQAEPVGNMGPAPNPADKGRRKERAVYVKTYYPGTTDQRQASAVGVTSGGTATANFTVMSNVAYGVSGTVTGLGTAQMAHLLLIGKGGESQEQDLGEGGRFDFPSVQPGEYGFKVIEVTGLDNGQKPTMRMESIRTTIVVSGEDVLGLTLEPETGGTVRGTFRMEGDEKVDWTLVSVTLQAMAPPGEEEAEVAVLQFGGEAATANVNEDGSFELKDVPGGDYQLVVGAKTDYFRDYYTKKVLLDGRDVADTGFNVSGGAALDVLMSPKGASIAGTVVDAKGQPVPDAYVVTAPSSGKRGRPDSYQMARSDVNGNFELQGLNPGAFTVMALEKLKGDVRGPEFLQKYGERGVKVSLEEWEKKRTQLTVIGDEGKQ